MKFNIWNEWSSNNDVPFEKNDACTFLNIKKSTQQIGHGEVKFAHEISGSISVCDDYDVDGKNCIRWEIKQVRSDLKQGNFRTTIKPRTSGHNFKLEIQSIVKQIYKAFCELEQNNSNLHLKMSCIVDMIYNSVEKGNINGTLIFGKLRKKKDNIIGLLQIIEKLNSVIIERTNNKSIQALIGEHEIQDLSKIQYIKITKILGLNINDIIVDDIDIMISHLEHVVFRKPNLLYTIWNSIDVKNTLLESANMLALVDEINGYFPMYNNIKNYIKFRGMTGKDINFNVTKSLFL